MQKDLIRLTLIDDATDAMIGESEVELENVPESFRPETILLISDQEWSVVQAEPTTRDEYVESGQVVLRLERVEHVDPKKILFSLPTIWHSVPPTEGPLLEGRELLLHEDDWRQVELVSRSLERVVNEELAEIAEVSSTSRVEGAGYRNIHVRKRLEHPLQGVDLPLERLRKAFESANETRVVLHESSNCVSRSFSFFLTRHFALYGLENAARVEVLAAADLGHEQGSVPPLHEIRQLAARYDLLVVDWCGGRAAGADDSAFEAVLRGA